MVNVITKAGLGLGNVDNTSDADKPVSTAQQTALDLKVAKAGDTMTGTLNIFVPSAAVVLQLRRTDTPGAPRTNYAVIDLEDTNGSGSAIGELVRIAADLDTITAGAEDGTLRLLTKRGGTLANRLTISAGAQIGAPTGGDKGAGTLNLDNDLYKDGVKVVGAQGATVADATDAATAITQLNALLARIRAHGLIAT